MTSQGPPPLHPFDPSEGSTDPAGSRPAVDAAAAMERLLGVVSRLTRELAATQVAVQELTSQIARAGIGAPAATTSVVSTPPFDDAPVPASTSTQLPSPPGPGADAPSVGASFAPQANGVDPSSSMPPRRGDHAVAPDGFDPRTIAPEPTRSAETALAAVRPLDPEWTTSPPRDAPVAPTGIPVSSFEGGRRDRPPSLADVPLLSAGSVEVLMGPVRNLTDLDALQGRIIEMPGVDAATVTAFEGQDVLMSVDLDRPLPLASMLRTELGRDVASCRLVEGRIVVSFAVEERPA